MNKTKLTPQQKAYVKSIDSKKKRKKQKEEFLMHNFFDSILKESGDSTTTAIVLNFEPDQSQPIEKPSITKEILREVTDPKISKHVNYGCFKNDRKPKTYTHEDMFNCFSESRLTNPIVGFKHDSFAAYLKSLG